MEGTDVRMHETDVDVVGIDMAVWFGIDMDLHSGRDLIDLEW